MVCGVALESPDLNGTPLLRLAHADALAQDLGRTNAGARTAKDIGVENLEGGTLDVVGGDRLDEAGNVDGGGARLETRRVVAEITAVRFNQRGLACERRMDITEIGGVFRRRQSAAGDIRTLSTSCFLRH